jgi:hypothetical protein
LPCRRGRGPDSWWRTKDVADPTNPNDFYITDFSSREKPGQDLDVAAPGSWTAVPLPPGCRKVVDPNIGLTTFCWAIDAAGAGLATADAAPFFFRAGTRAARWRITSHGRIIALFP